MLYLQHFYNKTYNFPDEAQLILSSSLSSWLPQDCLIWSQTQTGNFSTHSAYKLLAGGTSANNTSNSNLNSQKSFWRGIWKLRIPNKVRHFAWRACKNVLPTVDNLFRRHIAPVVLCNNCNTELKDPLHVVWGCKEVDIVWSNLSRINQTVTSPPTDFFDLISRSLQFHDDHRKKIFVLAAWLCGIAIMQSVLVSLRSHTLWLPPWLVACSRTFSMLKNRTSTLPSLLPSNIGVLLRATTPLVWECLFEITMVSMSGKIWHNLRTQHVLTQN